MARVLEEAQRSCIGPLYAHHIVDIMFLRLYGFTYMTAMLSNVPWFFITEVCSGCVKNNALNARLQ